MIHDATLEVSAIGENLLCDLLFIKPHPLCVLTTEPLVAYYKRLEVGHQMIRHDMPLNVIGKPIELVTKRVLNAQTLRCRKLGVVI